MQSGLLTPFSIWRRVGDEVNALSIFFGLTDDYSENEEKHRKNHA
jgi:hypothetical protein